MEKQEIWGGPCSWTMPGKSPNLLEPRIWVPGQSGGGSLRRLPPCSRPGVPLRDLFLISRSAWTCCGVHFFRLSWPSWALIFYPLGPIRCLASHGVPGRRRCLWAIKFHHRNPRRGSLICDRNDSVRNPTAHTHILKTVDFPIFGHRNWNVFDVLELSLLQGWWKTSRHGQMASTGQAIDMDPTNGYFGWCFRSWGNTCVCICLAKTLAMIRS